MVWIFLKAVKFVSKLLILSLALSLSNTVFADFREGLDAYNKGDYETAYKQWKPLAKAGDAEAQYNLGFMYRRGEGVKQDDEKAAYWYRRAADQGDAEGQYILGVMYEHGSGVAQDYHQAISWYLKATEQQYASAQYSLAVMYYNGRGVAKDMSKVKYWIRQAYEGNDSKISKIAGETWSALKLWQY